MNCQESQHAMDQRIASLPGSEEIHQGLRDHLMSCSGCSDRYDELTAVDGLIAAQAIETEPSPFLWTRIEARLAQPQRVTNAGWFGITGRWPALAAVWLQQRQLATALCMLILLVSIFFINQQSVNFERFQLLGQIDRQAAQFEAIAGSDNPFRLDLSSVTGESGNPFPALPEINVDKNPFANIKS